MRTQMPRIILMGSGGFLGGQLFQEITRLGYRPERAKCDLTDLEVNHSRSKFDLRRTILISMTWTSNSKRDYLNNPENLVWAKKHIDFAKFCLKNDYFFLVPGSCLEYEGDESIAYVASKTLLRKFLEEYVPPDMYLWPRYFYVFSLIHRRPGLIRDALEAQLRSQPLIVDNLKGRHDYIEVRDAIGQTIELIERRYNGIWDIGTGRTRSNIELLMRVKNVKVIENQKVEILREARPSWEQSAKKLIPNYTQFASHTSRFFDTL
jgi:hypothetical protein